MRAPLFLKAAYLRTTTLDTSMPQMEMIQVPSLVDLTYVPSKLTCVTGSPNVAQYISVFGEKASKEIVHTQRGHWAGF